MAYRLVVKKNKGTGLFETNYDAERTPETSHTFRGVQDTLLGYRSEMFEEMPEMVNLTEDEQRMVLAIRTRALGNLEERVQHPQN